ncbi:MAG: glycosyl hydrolase, partial [Clostridiales bacterium]|nr:glycosyl hydrolase [Clostridiales bacterium]
MSTDNEIIDQYNTDDAYIDGLVAQMTLEEKASLASGKGFWTTEEIDRLGIPSVMMTDGPHGIRKVDETKRNNVMQESHKATCFPTAVTVANSWNRGLAYEMGHAVAEEAKHFGVTTVLGPGVNIKRSPLCGRNFEYYSEDPHLAGEIGAAFVNGVQENGVGTSLKHYCANNQEHLRLTIDAEVDERALREIYLSAFEKIVKEAQPTTIMCSYNSLNGTYVHHNKKVLTDILRDEWGFKGLVMSDWGAVAERVKSVEAGLDLQMPMSLADNKNIINAVKSGELDEAKLDVIVKRLIKFAFNCKKNEIQDYKADFQANHDLTRRIAADGAVLLKNEDSLLPVSKDELKDCLIVGALAKYPRYQGTGSSKINPMNVVGFTGFLDAQNIPYNFLEGYKLKNDNCYAKNMLLKAREASKT